jgi:hypothetical protein
MSKIKRYDGLPRVTKIPEGGTTGAILGVNLRDSSGRLIQPSEVLNPTDDGARLTASTIWRLIREIPANIVKVAALVGTGFTTRGNDGEWHQRTLQQGTGITVQNGDGVAGDPSIALADLANSGTGTAIYKTTRDAKGRTSGQVTANTDDLPESGAPTNVWFTNARADARIALFRKVPARLSSGASSPIPLNANGTVPAKLANGTVSNIPVVP